MKGTSNLRSDVCYSCAIAFAKVWSPPVLTAPAIPPTKVQYEGTSSAFLTAFREVSENSQCGRVLVGRGLGLMYSRRLLWQRLWLCKASGSVKQETFFMRVV